MPCSLNFSRNERSLSSVFGKSTCASVHWTYQPSAASHHRDFVMVTYWPAFSSPSLSFSFISSSCISPATVGRHREQPWTTLLQSTVQKSNIETNDPRFRHLQRQFSHPSFCHNP